MSDIGTDHRSSLDTANVYAQRLVWCVAVFSQLSAAFCPSGP